MVPFCHVGGGVAEFCLLKIARGSDFSCLERSGCVVLHGRFVAGMILYPCLKSETDSTGSGAGYEAPEFV